MQEKKGCDLAKGRREKENESEGEEEARWTQWGIPMRTQCTQGDSSLRELGLGSSPLLFSLYPVLSCPGGLGGSYGVAIVAAGVANRFSAISPRLPTK
jgi:hypothetical protein